MGVLVGSKALEYYVDDLGRVTHDFDVWLSDWNYTHFSDRFKKQLVKETDKRSIFEINGKIVEVKKYSQLWETDKEIFDRTNNNLSPRLDLSEDFSLHLFIPSISDLYVMKATTVPFINEPKHRYDKELIEKRFVFHVAYDFMQRRMEETEKHFNAEKKVKYDFFHKYHIPEYIVHDYLHEIIADLLELSMPTYQRITVAETDIAEDLFNNLTHEQKIFLMVEESLVLALERWFIPQMVENGINYKIVENFYSNNEGFATYNILKHCCITGLKGEAEYITNFSRNNFFEIEKAWQTAKTMIKCKGGFPKEFFDKIFDLRERYKRGEIVGTV